MERTPSVVIEARRSWELNLGELREYTDLWYFLIWRDIKARYAQSVLGVGWALIQPVFSMIIFTIVFSRVAQIDSDGIPYPIFSYAALVPWIYFSNALTEGSASLVKNSNMLSKIYFPRLIIPLTAVFGRLIDFAISFLLLFVLMLWFQVTPTVWVLTLPFLILLMICTAAGLALWLSTLGIQFRDVNYGMSFGIQLMMYAAPVVYPTSLIPEQYRLLYGLNPMVGVIEGFRASLLGFTPMPWDLLATGSFTATLLLVSGAFYFRRKEAIFADVA